MKWIIVAIVLVNNQPNRVVGTEQYDTLADCNYHMMRQVFQMHTAEQWSMSCVQVAQ